MNSRNFVFHRLTAVGTTSHAHNSRFLDLSLPLHDRNDTSYPGYSGFIVLHYPTIWRICVCVQSAVEDGHPVFLRLDAFLRAARKQLSDDVVLALLGYQLIRPCVQSVTLN
jgi:hypothetical protein